MQTTSKPQRSIYFNIPISIFLGLLIGVLTLGFIKALNVIELFHNYFNSGTPYHLIIIPLVLVIIYIAKRQTLYFPAKVSQLHDEVSSQYWTPMMTPFHYLGTILSHLSGVSVGREGAVVLYSAGLVRLFSMSWLYWGPIASTIGFSAVVGNYWVAPFFMSELYKRSSFLQKLYGFMGSIVAVLLMKSFQEESLFSKITVQTDMGFFKKLMFFFFFALSAGLLMRVYKKVYFLLSDYFSKSGLSLKIFIAFLLAVFLYFPEFRKFQSLGLQQFSDLQFLDASFFNVIVKLFFTLISTTVGFFGGEFIPLIYSGVQFGHSFFSYFGYDPILGALLAAYLLFASATRFKWTSYVLILALMGFGWWFWAYFVVSVAVGFSGESSIYKKETAN